MVVLAFFPWTPLPAIGVGVGCLIWRPSSGGRFGLVLLVLAAAPLLALLPPLEPERLAWASLLERPGFSLTPQPRVLLSLWPTHLSAIVFLWWISGRTTEEVQRGRESAVLAAGAVISLLLVAGRWESGDWRGPTAELFARFFEGRNLAAGFAAVAFAGCAVKALREEQANDRAAWWVGCAASLAPLLTLGSRGAMAAAILGGACGGIRLVFLHRKNPVTRRRIVLGGALIVVVAGGCLAALRVPLVERFVRDGVSGLGMRAAIQQDAWAMAMEHAATGVGMGSFEDVFPMFRSASASTVRAAHPESDWLWLVCESGLLTGLFAWGVAVALARRCWRQKDDGVVGLAALVAVLVHGLLDVPAHSAPVFFLAAALAGSGWLSRPSRVARPVGIGLILAALLLPAGPPRPAPFRPARPMVEGNPEAIEQWLAFRPLDHGVLELALHQSMAEGSNERSRILMERLFRLEPFSDAQAARAFSVLARQGSAPLAALAAHAILDRAGPDQRPARLGEILDASPPEVRREILAEKTSPEVARAFRLASVGDFKAACQMIVQSAGPTDSELLASPTTPDVARLALQELRAGNPARARAVLHAAQARSALSPEFWFVLGCAESQLGEYDEAWNAFEKFSDLYEDDPDGKPRAQ